MQPQFVYNIRDLEQLGVRDIDAPLEAAFLTWTLEGSDVQPDEATPGRLRIRLMMSGRDVVVRGQIDAPVIAACGRCLQPVRLGINTELTLFLVPGKSSAPARQSPAAKAARAARSAKKKGEATPSRPEPAKAEKARGWRREDGEEVYEFSPDEADSDTYSGDEVVLDPFVREAILLEIPIFPLCSEECPGIRPVPAEPDEPRPADESIDPRLAPLLALKRKS